MTKLSEVGSQDVVISSYHEITDIDAAELCLLSVAIDRRSLDICRFGADLQFSDRGLT